MRNASLRVFAVGAFIAFIFFSNSISLLTDYWWFREVNYTDIFFKTFQTQLIIGVLAGLATTIFLFVNLFFAAYSKTPWVSTIPESLTGKPISVKDQFIKKLIILISVIVGTLVGLVATTFWQELLQFFYTSPFLQKDPFFGKDISFYVFQLPAYTILLGLAKFIILLTLAGTVLIAVLRRSFFIGEILSRISFFPASQTSSASHKSLPFTRFHIGLLLALYLLITAIEAYLSKFTFLSTQSGSIVGASYTDATITIPLIQYSVFIYAFASVCALVYGMFGKVLPFVVSVVAVGIITGVQALLPPFVQRFIVAPNEFAKETPYIAKNIQATQNAYNLATVEKRKITGDQQLTPEIIKENAGTIKNVRLWDRDPLLSTFSQLQEIRTYYEFPSVDNDRYQINGELRQIMLSPREIQAESLPNRNWINEHLTFTHGYGIAAGPVNQVTSEGLPVLFVKNLPPVTEVKELTITRPEIYYGEIKNSYAIVNSASKEFDYPKGDESVYTKYSGSGGVQLDSFLKRIVFAIFYNEPKMILSSDITNNSKLLYNRNIMDRVKKVAPFLTFDNDPYLVVADGKLYWMVDAYTHTDKYPYSQLMMTENGKQINYMRNAVKIVVDAYNGSLTMYVADKADPLIQTYQKIYPTSFKPLSMMPKSLLSHIRYPEDLFRIQTTIYTTYHMEDPQTFYNKEDQWDIPGTGEFAGTAQSESKMLPRHLVMRLPNEKKEEFILMLPFTPRSKDNLSAWMVVRNDGDSYGKLVAYTFPKDVLVFGPKQIMGRINQDAEVSRQISLWDQRGSQVIQGPLLVIPIEEALVYVRPLYLKAQSGKIPELKRVIVAYKDKIAMQPTLEEGLNSIFGNQATQTTQSQTTTEKQNQPVAQTQPSELMKQAKQAYDSALEAQKNGDWTRYGEEIKKLGTLLQQIDNK